MVPPLTDPSAFIQILVLVSRIDCQLMTVMLHHSDVLPINPCWHRGIHFVLCVVPLRLVCSGARSIGIRPMN